MKTKIKIMFDEIEKWNVDAPLSSFIVAGESEDPAENQWRAEAERLACEVELLAGEVAADNKLGDGLFALSVCLRDGGDPTEILARLRPRLCAIAQRKPRQTDNVPHDDLVTLGQVAALAGLRKRSLERYLRDAKIRKPDRPGGGGRPNLWYYANIRPDLEKVSKHALPDKFPGTSFPDGQ